MAASRNPRNRVRIIGGLWRSRNVTFIPHPDLRPTPDRVRETLFNWLGQDLTGKICLDLFAGSGALGFEAASRGAQRVVLVESDAAAYRKLAENAALLGADKIEMKAADALEFLRSDRGVYDVVFLDPPFRSDMLPAVLALLPSRLASRAMVHIEVPLHQEANLPSGWQVWRAGRAGAVAHQLLKWNPDA
jgi:16S rRNA (guanine(966)-N(2))-methyltransferase RsmD